MYAAWRTFVSKTPLATKKLEQARFFLGLIRAENQKAIAKDAPAIEAFLSACLGATKAAFYRLEKEVGKTVFKGKKTRWHTGLDVKERKFFNWMMKQRDLDVHETDPKTTLKQKAIPAYVVPGVHVVSPPGVLVPNPDPSGHPRFAPGWVIHGEVQLGAQEATAACEKFINLMDSLLSQF